MTGMQWKNKTLFQVLDETAERIPDNEALVYGNRRITFKELRNKSRDLAKSFLKSGIKKGDKVSILMPNRPEWIFARDAAIRAGALWVPMSTRYEAMELEFILKHADVHTIVMIESAVNIDFVKKMTAICPELLDSSQGRIKSEKFPSLKNIVCIADREIPGMFNFEEFLEFGKDVTDAVLDAASGEIKPDDFANITYTSGTTGTPKGVLTKHSQFLQAMGNIGTRFKTTEEDCILLAAPLFTNIGNLTGLIQGEMYGAKMVLFEIFDPPRILNGIETEQCTIFTGAPAMYAMIMDQEGFTKEKVKSMRTGIIGGAPVTPEMVRQIQEKIGMKLFTAYGMTENSGITTMSEVNAPPEVIAQTCGRLLHENCEMKIIDPESGQQKPPGQSGEIVTKGWLVMHDYYKNPTGGGQIVDDAGWFHTGDLGKIDENGYLQVTGRLKDIIISGGFNIDPVEIEHLINTHPSVASVQIVGLPDQRMGEVVGAFIIKKEPELTEEMINQFCTGKVAKYKIPKHVLFVDEFPATAYGKIQKFKLRDLAVKEYFLTGT